MADGIVREIKEKLDVAEVIGSYLQLKRAGVNFRANCPFHNEKSPSFNVNPARQIWHCFGCGEGGDVFTFVQKYEHLDFPETLKLLADRAGVRLPERTPGQRSEEAKQRELKERLWRVNSYAAKFYNFILQQAAGASALAYLRKRGIEAQTIEHWQIGYAPEGYRVLEDSLLQKGARKEDLVLAGVSVRSDRGTYDRFRGRVTFPIFDFNGNAVGFSARILAGDMAAKYINSPESPVYSKGSVLFGLFQAKGAIRNADYVVVVEGQMDCIKAHQAGFLNTVATSGTALTAEQLRLLSRLTKNLKLCFDADVAGQRAAKKAGELALSMGFSVKVITVVGAKDPDELISQDPKLWEEALQSSVWFVEHFLIQAEKGFPARSVEQRKFITHEVAPLLRLVTDALERDHYVQSITERFGFSQQAVLDMLRTGNQPASPLGGLSPEVSVVPDELPVPLIEKQMLGVLLAEPTLRQEWLDLGGRVEDFTDLRARELVALALTSGNSAVTSQSLAQEALFMVESEKTREDGNEAVFLSELQKITYSFRLAALKARQQQVTANIRTADGQKNVQALHELQREFAGLSVARLDLEKKIQSI